VKNLHEQKNLAVNSKVLRFTQIVRWRAITIDGI